MIGIFKAAILGCFLILPIGVSAHQDRYEPLERGLSPDDPVSWARKIQQNYPSQALRNGDEGTVFMEIAVDEEGRVIACEVVKSSGSATLDEAACSGMMEYARYLPALSDRGEPIPASTKQAIRYVLPEAYNLHQHPEAIDQGIWREIVFTPAVDEAIRSGKQIAISYQLVVDESGRAVGCGVLRSSGQADIDRQICNALKEESRFEPARLRDGETIPGAYYITHLVPRGDD